MSAPDLLALAERVEAATGPDAMSVEMRTLNADVLRALGWRQDDRDVIDPAGNVRLQVPFYIGSLDAAVTLVPEGCGWIAGWGQTRPDEPMGGATISRNARFIGYGENYDTFAEAEAATPALALTAAALRARAAEQVKA